MTSTGQNFCGNNTFAYCLNNPTNFADYDGKSPEELFAWWCGSMGWIMLVDFGTIAGEIIYFGGMIILHIATLSLVKEIVSKLTTWDSNVVASKDKSSGTSSGNGSSTGSGGSPTPQSPKKPGNNITFSKEFKADNTYNKNGVRVDYEYNGNGTGNVHIHKNGQKYHYDTRGYLKNGPGKSAERAPTSIQRLLYDTDIMKAIIKGLRIIEGLGGHV